LNDSEVIVACANDFLRATMGRMTAVDTSLRLRTPLLPLAAAGVTVVLWASAFIAIRSVGVHYEPGPMALGRLIVGAVALSAFALWKPIRIPRGRPLALVIAYGALWFGLYAVSLNAAEQHLDAGTAALIVNVAPIIIAVMSGVFLGEGF